MTPALEADLELVRRSIPGAMAYAVLLGVIGLFTPYTAENPWILETAVVLLAITGILRIILARRLLASTDDFPSWGRVAFRVGVLTSATIWTFVTVLMVAQYPDEWVAMMMLLMTAGIAAGGLTSLAPNARLAQLYICVMLFPPLVTAAVTGGTHGYAIAVTIGIFVVFLFADCRFQARNYWRSLSDRTALQMKAAELEEARKLAHEGTLAKSNFLANMSHEIRTPMNAVIGMTELLLDSRLSAEERDNCVRVIKESSESLLEIVNDILDLSKIEAGKLELDPSNFSLRESVHDVLRSLALRADSKGLELLCQVQADVPDKLVGDVVRLRQILVNLVGNAIKFTGEGGVSIRIRLEEKAEQSCTLHFEVIDTGIGIPEDKHHLIFEPFTQADGSTTRKFGGTGLGLGISRTFVEMMNGRIWFESAPAKGSTFHFTARFEVQTAEKVVEPGVKALSDLQVLIVDSDHGNARDVAEIVTNWRMRATVVDNCRAALAALEDVRRKGAPFDFILIDARMPAQEGAGLVEQVVKDADGAAPIMMVNSKDQAEEIARCRELGVHAYLVKPITESDLFDAMMVSRGYHAAPDADPLIMTRDFLRDVRRTLRVLLAEDNPVNQMVASQMLMNRGHEVIVVSNGQEAVNTLATQSFDLIVMDIQMPVMDGLQATAAIREKESRSGGHIPIIAMTAHAMKGDRERCIEAGMDAFVSKPVRSRELYQAIDALTQSISLVPRPAEERPAKAVSSGFDRDSFMQRVGGNAELIRSVIRVFSEESPGQISRIRAAIETGDAPRLASEAHTLRGSLLALSADLAAETLLQLENMGRENALTGCEELVELLDAQVARLMQEMQVMVNTLAETG